MISRFDFHFIGFTTIDKIDVFYNKRLQIWLYNLSNKKIKLEANNNLIYLLKHDEKGNITNAEFSGTTTDGIPLTEKDFIQEEFNQLDRLITFPMTFDESKRVEFYREFLDSRLKGIIQKDSISQEEETNPYPEVFKTPEAFQLFTRLYNNKIDSNTPLADFSFIYRRMFKDGLLHDHQKPEVFRQWLSKEPYEVILDNKFKTLSNCTTLDKEDSYNTAKLLIQRQK